MGWKGEVGRARRRGHDAVPPARSPRLSRRRYALPSCVPTREYRQRTQTTSLAGIVILFYPRAGRRLTHCRLRPAPRTHTSGPFRSVCSVPFSPGQSRIPTVTAEMARLPLLGGAPPVDLLRLDARRNCRRKHPDALVGDVFYQWSNGYQRTRAFSRVSCPLSSGNSHRPAHPHTSPGTLVGASGSRAPSPSTAALGAALVRLVRHHLLENALAHVACPPLVVTGRRARNRTATHPRTESVRA